jgi:peptidoglycan/xylan/chitin deacetylase (PgdA/CDA1 family)
MKAFQFLLPATMLFAVSCSSNNDVQTTASDSVKVSAQVSKTEVVENKPVADAAVILARKQVPVLCYHHIREAKPGQSETLKNYSVSPAQFAEQMKALKDSGYTSILPNDLYNYLAYGTELPAKPVMLTFDDTDEEQFTIGWKEMEKNGFHGVFFLMTISINRPRYMSKEQIKELAEKGNAIEAHTWDHHMVTKYQGEDWEKQLIQPMKKVEEITGKPAKYFAYPFGVWNKAAIPEVEKAGYKMAFCLSGKRDSTQPLFTVRRMLVPGQWSTPGMFKAMKRTFE